MIVIDNRYYKCLQLTQIFVILKIFKDKEVLLFEIENSKTKSNPTNIYLFKVNNRNTRKR